MVFRKRDEVSSASFLLICSWENYQYRRGLESQIVQSHHTNLADEIAEEKKGKEKSEGGKVLASWRIIGSIQQKRCSTSSPWDIYCSEDSSCLNLRYIIDIENKITCKKHDPYILIVYQPKRSRRLKMIYVR